MPSHVPELENAWLVLIALSSPLTDQRQPAAADNPGPDDLGQLSTSG